MAVRAQSAARHSRQLTGRPIAVNLLLPFLRPGDVEAAAATDAIDANLVDAGPLYAGMNVVRITDIRPAAELAKALTP